MQQITSHTRSSHVQALLQQSVPLASLCWFRTGGPAEWFAEPNSTEEFVQLVQWASSQNIPITILGEGANILIHDAGIAGLVIRPALTHISFEQDPLNREIVLVTAGAGLSFGKLIESCLEQQFLGLEEFSGIPGTVGGSVFINIHYFQWLLSDFLVKATVVHRHTGSLCRVDKTWFNFGYNQSTLQLGDYYLVDATFKLKKADMLQTAFAKGRRTEMIRSRGQKYPKAHTCGSFFRNFREDEVTLVSNSRKMTFIAYYLDKLGIKGELSVGDATVSYQHANMIVTREGATTADVIALAQQMQKLVYDAYGIMPQPECQLLGFATNPLIQNS